MEHRKLVCKVLSMDAIPLRGRTAGDIQRQRLVMKVLKRSKRFLTGAVVRRSIL